MNIMLHVFRILLVAASCLLAFALPNPGDEKIVIAHMIIGNTYPFQLQDWQRTIDLAQSKGIDGFALNMGRNDWEPARVADAYKACIGKKFKLFMMFDMASMPCSSPEHGDPIRKMITDYDGHSNQLKYQGKTLVSTFGGQFCTFGKSRMDEGWSQVMKTNLVDVHFCPAFFISPPVLPSLKAIDGAFSWDSAWPMGNYDTNSEYDDEYLKYLPDRSYMAGISPWFFTHYGPNSYNKNLIYRGDDWLIAERWENIISYRDKIGIVQMISWNDYGESHYMGPIDGAQPQSESWTNGFDHQAFLDLSQFYIKWYKTGSRPDISKDRVWVWGRLYPSKASAPDSVGRPMNADWTEDYIWIITLLSKAGRLDVSCANSRLTTDLPAGVNKSKMLLTDDCTPHVTVTNSAQKTVDFTPSGYNFKKTPPSYNFNTFVAMSPA